MSDASNVDGSGRSHLDVTHLGRALWRRLAVHDGFTVDPRSGDPVTAGLAVCADPARSVRVPWEACDGDRVASWVAMALRHLRPTGIGLPPLRLGGWRDRRRDEVHLDLVVVVPAHEYDHARWLAQRHRQRALFDLGGQRLVRIEVSR
jgi:hypothetical protein